MNPVVMNPVALYPTPPALRIASLGETLGEKKPRWLKLGRLTPVGLSILIHGLLFIYFGANLFDDGGLPLKHGPISVRLQAASAPVVTTAETPEALPAKLPAPLSSPLVSLPRAAQAKPVTPAALSTAKSPGAIPPPSADERPVAQSEPQTDMQSEAQPEMPAATPTATTTVVKNTPALATTEQRQQIKQHYLATLMAHIESHKYYPRTARQRRMEGQTTVQFTLLASGEICEINISNGPKLLRIASKAALQKALPLPKPPSTIDYPLPIQFDMEYRLI